MSAYSEDEVRFILREVLGEEIGGEMYKTGCSISDTLQRATWFDKLIASMRSGTVDDLKEELVWKTDPVDPETFVNDEFFLNKPNALYPVVMDEFVKLNSGEYVEAVMTGGIGSGKTTLAQYTTAYQLYILSCMRDPHATFSLDPASEILFIFQSIHYGTAKMVEYDRFKSLIDSSNYFRRVFTYDKEIRSELKFPSRIILRPVSGMETATIGQNVIGGIIDELNYMAVVTNSKSAVDGGVYDQAISLYNSVARRRRSRFMYRGRTPGILCLVSSRRYPGQFTDTKEEEAKNDPTIYVFDKCTWDIKPESYSGERFPMFIGDETRKCRILEDDEEVEELAEEKLVKWIPVEHKVEFERDPINALREVAGVSTLARYPFIMDTGAIHLAVKKGRKSIFSTDWCDFDRNHMGFRPNRFKDVREPRFAHVDLGLTGDSAGVVVGYVKKFVEMEKGGIVEVLPHICIDGAVEVRPPKGGEIMFWKVRDMFFKLREMGLPISWVTYDSYQSVDSIQLLKNQGFMAGTQSVDIREPYDFMKTALYDQRIEMPDHDLLKKELASLEDNPETGRIDHPPHFSKDVADALAGVVYGLTKRRDIWLRHSVPLNRIPRSVLDQMQTGDEN